ncbi:MAG: hypothetical protein ABI444_05765 [Candidatus Kapaibacterium sp.]
MISGTSYPSTIGTTESVTSQVSNAMFGLEVGYRYEAQLGLRYAPFAEVLAGAGVGGMFNAARIGLVWQFTDLIRADCALRLDQLVTSASAPSHTIGLEATVGYAW